MEQKKSLAVWSPSCLMYLPGNKSSHNPDVKLLSCGAAFLCDVTVVLMSNLHSLTGE